VSFSPYIAYWGLADDFGPAVRGDVGRKVPGGVENQGIRSGELAESAGGIAKTVARERLPNLSAVRASVGEVVRAQDGVPRIDQGGSAGQCLEAVHYQPVSDLLAKLLPQIP
jgi:hypothetical protein